MHFVHHIRVHNILAACNTAAGVYTHAFSQHLLHSNGQASLRSNSVAQEEPNLSAAHPLSISTSA